MTIPGLYAIILTLKKTPLGMKKQSTISAVRLMDWMTLPVAKVSCHVRLVPLDADMAAEGLGDNYAYSIEERI